MIDITKCENEVCPLKETCYRYISEPDEIQTYAMFEPVYGKCEHYMEWNW